jgi:AAA+ superfamily predicted ATPase
LPKEPLHEPIQNYPEWVQHIRDAHLGGSSQTFILHGNVNDLIPIKKKPDAVYAMLPEFLSTQVFGVWEMVMYYDQVHGPRALASTQSRLNRINQNIERFIGPVESLKSQRGPAPVLSLLDRFLEQVLLMETKRPSVALIMDYAHFLIPSTSVSYTSREMASNLATLLNWAKSPYFKRVSFAFCLISERLSDLNASMVQNAHTTKIEIPFPGLEERLRFIKWVTTEKAFDELCVFNEADLARLTPGLTLVHLQGLLNRAIRTGKRINENDLKGYKKSMIESQCEGIVEFIEPKHKLDLVVGHEEAKKRLFEDVDLIRKGRLDAVPMGYLICGPVGTGKTFLAECYAGSVGIPCMKILNFRSKYVGETEGNLEKIFKVLRVMGPVAVIIDEADAMLGDREVEGDSGTSGRVFGQFAAQMGDTAYRGKIIWFLLTCRPDFLPIDLKRQGRCEVHIPLTTPDDPEQIKMMFLAMAQKNGIDIREDDLPSIPGDLKLSGADIEGIVTRAKRHALLSESEKVNKEHLRYAFSNFLPSVDSDEKRLQLLSAVLECTDINFLPREFQKEINTAKGRAAIMNQFRMLKQSLEQA